MLRVGRSPFARGRWLIATGALYVLVYALTVQVSAHPIRPLYDATGVDPVAYQWVKPPTDLSVDNVKPTSVRSQINPTVGGTVSTPDAQAIVTFPAGAVTTSGGDRGLLIDLNPVAPDRQTSVIGGRLPDGNAYMVRLFYEPSGTPVPVTEQPFDVALREPQFDLTRDVLLFGPTVRGPWRQLSGVQSGPDAFIAPTDKPGYYVLAGRSTGSGDGWRVIEGAAAGVGVLALVVFAIRRSRKNSPTH